MEGNIIYNSAQNYIEKAEQLKNIVYSQEKGLEASFDILINFFEYINKNKDLASKYCSNIDDYHNPISVFNQIWIDNSKYTIATMHIHNKLVYGREFYNCKLIVETLPYEGLANVSLEVQARDETCITKVMELLAHKRPKDSTISLETVNEPYNIRLTKSYRYAPVTTGNTVRIGAEVVKDILGRVPDILNL